MLSRLTIRTKLFFSIVLILLITYSLILLTSYASLNRYLQEEIYRDLRMDLLYAKAQFTSRGAEMRLSLQQPAGSPWIREKVRTRDIPALQEALTRWRRNMPFVDLLLFTDPSGRIIASPVCDGGCCFPKLDSVVRRAVGEGKPLLATEVIPLDLLKCEAKGEPQITAVALDGELLMYTAVVPVTDGSGRKLGAIIAGDIINGDYTIPVAAQKVAGKTVEVWITQGRTKVASTSGASKLPASLEEGLYRSLSPGAVFRGEAVEGGKRFQAATEPLTDASGRVVGSLAVALSDQSYRSIIDDTFGNLAAVAAFGILLSFFLAWFAARRLSRPLQKLAHSALNIAQGNLHERVCVDGEREVGILVTSFNSMAAAVEERDRVIRKKNHDLQELNSLLNDRVRDRTLELETEKGRLEAILTSMSEGVVVTDRSDRIILLNTAAQAIFSVELREALGRPLIALYSGAQLKQLLRYMLPLRRSGGGVTEMQEMVEIRGRQFKVSLSPLMLIDNEFSGVVMSLRDVTAEQEMERMKSEFIAAVSHELKTPLTCLKGGLQLLAARCGERDQGEELMEVCLRNTDRLIELTGQILNYTRLESGKKWVFLAPVDPAAVISRSVTEVEAELAEKGIRVENRFPAALPTVYADSEKMGRVITALLKYAARCGPAEGVVSVDAKREGNYLRVLVEGGEGELQMHDPSDAGEAFGLVLSREIVEAHHGKLDYDPKFNTISFTVAVWEEQ